MDTEVKLGCRTLVKQSNEASSARNCAYAKGRFNLVIHA